LPGGNILLDKLRPGSRLRVKKLQTRFQGLSQVVARLLNKQLVLEVLVRDGRRQGGLILLWRNLYENSLLARNLREGVHNFFRGVVLGGRQNLLVL
jgi:hypothetical protein